MNISIIIPVYNAAKFIERCVKSLFEQKEHGFNLEIILCNDGSSDNSLEILKKLETEHQEIKVYDNENQGVYKTRNFALTKVTGDYIWFLDSDDYIFPDALQLVQKKLRNDYPDILNFGYVRENTNGTSTVVFPPKNENIIDGITFLENNDGRLYLWNNIYNAKFIAQNKLSFLAKSVSLEDSLFNLNAFSNASTVKYLDSSLYCYCYNENSISKTKSLDHLMKLGQSSINVHGETQKLKNTYAKSTRAYNVLNLRLEHSVLGFFYSLLVEKYPQDYIKMVFAKYKKYEILPLNTKTANFKIKVLQTMVNRQWPFLFVCSMYKILKK